nr:hypothetical protein BaRGS_013646 [Batillaria attramentaria]
METTTTNKLDYKEHQLERRQPLKPIEGNLRSEGSQDFTSSYQKTFLGQPGERTQPIRHDKKREELGKFSGEPSYKADYKEWTLPPRYHHEGRKWDPPVDRFEADTTNKRDYHEHQVSPREQHKRTDGWKPPTEPFMDATGYRDVYHEHPLPKRERRQREVYQAPAARFNTQTTQQSDFTGPYQPKRESFKPNRQAISSDVPFEASTTSKSDYVEKPIESRRVRASQEYVRPEGHMDLNTTNQREFKEHPLSRHVINKPGSSHILQGTGPMTKESGYAAEFIERHTERRETMKPRNAYEAPTTRFEGTSTAKRDFVEKQLSPRESCRPKREAMMSDAPFDGSTDYRSSFVEKPIPPRRQPEKQRFVAPAVPFNASTTTRESYHGDYVPSKRASFKPDQTPVKSDARFEGMTTAKESFVTHEISPRYRHEQARYIKPEGEMDLKTSNQETFREVRADRYVITKPSSSHVLRGTGKFEDRSSYMGDFTEKPRQIRQIMKPKNEYEPSAAKFEGISTNRESFRGAYAPRQPSFRPPARPLQNLNAFEDQTNYRADYNRDRYTWSDAAPQIPPLSV